MKPPQRDSDLSENIWLWATGFLRPVWIVILSLLISGPPAMVEGAPPALHTKEYTITIDATALNPPTWWQVPGVTTMIMTMDPDSTEAFKTTVPHDLKLKPGSYRFGTFTFDFPFVVTLDGVLDFAPSLDQCVSGRGTQRLAVRCSRTQPYGGQPDY
jgi:hypothetical protein